MAIAYQIKATDKRDGAFYFRVTDPGPLMERIAAASHSMIIGKVKSGVKPDNAPLTKAVKRGNHTLMDNGLLINSINRRSSEREAIVSSNHIAALVNNPEDLSKTHYEVVPRKAQWLTLPASWNTRTLMRRYGFTPREVITGLEKDGYSVFRPFRKGSNTVRANVIMAVKKGSRKLPSGKRSSAKRFQPFVVFILSKKVRVPIRRFMYLDEAELALVDQIVEDYYA